MKVGALVGTLFFLLVRPSATVLSLTGSIDRTMKAGVALLLISSLHVATSNDDKYPDEVCTNKKMTCFAPTGCQFGDNDLRINEISANPLTKDCKVIMKIRRYNPSMLRVVLESRDKGVNAITVKRESTEDVIFSCKVGTDPKYKSISQKSINHTDSPLMCEFVVADSSEIFLSQTSKILITTDDTEFKPWIKEISVYNTLDDFKFCDAAKAVYDDREPDVYTLTKPTIGLDDISCEAPYDLETKVNINELPDLLFTKTESIICEGEPKKFAIKRINNEILHIDPSKSFNVRCSVKTCSLCNYLPATTSDPAPSIVDSSDGCKELKCTTGQLKVGDSLGVATCKKNGDKSIWDLNGTPIDSTTAVACVTELKCPTNTTLCEKCIRDSNEVKCSDGESVILNSKKVTISCDTNIGKWTFTEEGGMTIPLPDNAQLTCPSKETANQKNTSSASATTIGVIVSGVIVLVGLIIFIVIYIYRKRNAQIKNGKTVNSMEPLSKQPTSKSKESKKEAGQGEPMATLVPIPIPIPDPVPPAPSLAHINDCPAMKLERAPPSHGYEPPRQVESDQSTGKDERPTGKQEDVQRTGIIDDSTGTGLSRGRVPNRDRETNRGCTPDTTKGTTTSTKKGEGKKLVVNPTQDTTGIEKK